MPIQQITPNQAKAILDGDPSAIYVDVRSIPEFIQGHAKGAINIPLMHSKEGQMTPNPDFPRVVQAVIPKGTKIVVGCKMGGRSQKACEILDRVGLENIFNIDGGFGGNERQKGWKDLGLPVTTENGEGVSYESLSKRADK